jgi:uncharacterized protein involved in cysteine biosynthesis
MYSIRQGAHMVFMAQTSICLLYRANPIGTSLQLECWNDRKMFAEMVMFEWAKLCWTVYKMADLLLLPFIPFFHYSIIPCLL